MKKTVKEAEKVLMEQYIYRGVRAVLAEPGIEKKNGKDAVPYLVDRVTNYVAEQTGQSNYYLIYTILFDYLFETYFKVKKEAQEENKLRQEVKNEIHAETI